MRYMRPPIPLPLALLLALILVLPFLGGCGTQDSSGPPRSVAVVPADDDDDTPDAGAPTLTVSVPAAGATLTVGADATTVSAELRDGDGALVAGATVTFAVSSSSVAELSAATDVTDIDGVASVDLSGVRAGTVSVSASYLTVDSNAESVTVVAPTVTIESDVSQLTASDAQGDGATLTAEVNDHNGAAMEDVTVTFATNLGTLQQTTLPTGADGSVQVVLTSTKAGDALVTASALGATSDRVEIEVVAAAVDEVTVTPSPSQVPPDGITQSTILIEAVDEFDNPVDGTATLSATLGILSTDNADGSDGTVAVVDGTASATWTTTAVGESTVTATIAIDADTEVSDNEKVFGVEDLTGNPASISIQVAQETISIAGVGGEDVTTITVTVLDNGNNPIDDSSVVNNLTLEIVKGPDGGENIQGMTQDDGPLTLTTSGGLASANFQAGLLPGTVLIQVSVIKKKDGTPPANPITAVVPQITIRAGEPFDLILGRENGVTDNQDGTLTQEYVAEVTDRQGNNVPDGTAVYFGQISNVLAGLMPGFLDIDFQAIADGAIDIEGVGNNVFESAAGGFDTNGVSAGDTLVIYDDDSINRGGYLVTRVVSDTQLEVLTEFETDESGLKYVVGNNRGGAVLISGEEVTTEGGVARWENTYLGDLVNLPVFVYAETSARQVGDAHPYTLSWLAPTEIVLVGVPQTLAAGDYTLSLTLNLFDSSAPTSYWLPNLAYSAVPIHGDVDNYFPAVNNGRSRTTQRAPDQFYPGGEASFDWTFTLPPESSVSLTVSAGRTRATFTVTAD